MHFTQNLRQSQRDALAPTPSGQSTRQKPESRREPSEVAKLARGEPDLGSDRKRLLRRKETWEDRVGMGAVGAEESFAVKETQKIRRDYLRELMRNEVGKNGQRFRERFLGRHKVSSEVRVRMVSD